MAGEKEGDKQAKFKEIQDPSSSAISEFKLNPHAPAFVPDSIFQMPNPNYFCQYLQFVHGGGGGGGVGTNFIYFEDQKPMNFVPDSNIKDPNLNKNTTDLIQKIVKQRAKGRKLPSQPASSRCCFRSKCRNFRSDRKGKSSNERSRTATKEPKKPREGDKQAKFKEIQDPSSSAISEFKLNPHAPAFVPDSIIQMPNPNYFCQYLQFVHGGGGGGGIGTNFIYFEDQKPMSFVPDSNIKDPNLNKNTTDLIQKIVKQVEYQFSDANLIFNDLLVKIMNKDPEGYVPMSVIASWKKIKNLGVNNQILVNALRTSSQLVVSEDGKKVRRKKLFTERAKEEQMSRTVVVENLPEDSSHQNIEKLFSVVGSVKNIRICHPQEPNSTRPSKTDVIISNKLHAFVEFETIVQADKAVEKLNDESNWRKGLRVRSLLKCTPRSVIRGKMLDYDHFDLNSEDDQSPLSQKLESPKIEQVLQQDMPTPNYFGQYLKFLNGRMEPDCIYFEDQKPKNSVPELNVKAPNLNKNTTDRIQKIVKQVEKLNDESNWRKGLRVRSLDKCMLRSVAKGKWYDHFYLNSEDNQSPLSQKLESPKIEQISENQNGARKVCGRGRGKLTGLVQNYNGHGILSKNPQEAQKIGHGLCENNIKQASPRPRIHLNFFKTNFFKIFEQNKATAKNTHK
ncbi:hypothetical protein M5K25_014485 [Dendrobium thyrsiflorum]|uniref:Uncharacterized protein n=1 Tax=Dendrobium thyrsiflorum TaxID=117978 RepID=A0ABD0V2Z5_DENTH